MVSSTLLLTLFLLHSKECMPFRTWTDWILCRWYFFFPCRTKYGQFASVSCRQLLNFKSTSKTYFIVWDLLKFICTIDAKYTINYSCILELKSHNEHHHHRWSDCQLVFCIVRAFAICFGWTGLIDSLVFTSNVRIHILSFIPWPQYILYKTFASFSFTFHNSPY